MLIRLGDWILDADLTLTMQISSNQVLEHCDCGYCRNFYTQVRREYPGLEPFLAQFGLYIEAPDELCPFEPTIYEASYIVQGRLIQKGTDRLLVEGLVLDIKSDTESDILTEHPRPYFVMTLGLMELPWALEEDMNEVISPANEEEYLQRMQLKLLNRLDDPAIHS